MTATHTLIPGSDVVMCDDCHAEAEDVRASYVVAGVPVCDSHLDIRSA